MSRLLKYTAALLSTLPATLGQTYTDCKPLEKTFLGSYTTQLKTDYFGEGDSSTFNRRTWESIDDPQSKFHNYTLSCTTTALTWSIEGTPTGFTKKTTDIRGGTKQQAWTSEMRDMPRDPAAGRTMY
ncbi:hypothetical protein AnigIFM60653_005879 [Aspergillus niger]|nr:hypothetical protein AnigIFM50267_008947 [Aspergillus niger]GLA05394.1 hypothetical protein AnigIFM60653_005879 [Aspergillus niger]